MGNGRLGAMVFGGVEQERLALNESTFWSGEPERPAREPRGAASTWPRSASLFFAGKYREGGRADGPIPPRPDATTTARICPWATSSWKCGTRGARCATTGAELDLDQAVARVEYSIGGVRVQPARSWPPPDGVLVVRLTADKPGQISFRSAIPRRQPTVESRGAGGTTRWPSPATPGRPSTATARPASRSSGLVRAGLEGGTSAPRRQRSKSKRADAVTLLVAVNTNFKGRDPAALCQEQIDAAASKTYAQIARRARGRSPASVPPRRARPGRRRGRAAAHRPAAGAPPPGRATIRNWRRCSSSTGATC